MIRHPLSAALFAAVCLVLNAPPQAGAQDFFVPNQPRPTQPPRPAAPRPAVQPARPVQPPPQQATEAEQQPAQIPLPPVPELPALPRGASPPAAVIGVIGVPDVMRVSTAAQQIDRIIGERREKLNADAQKEQGVWRELQQALANQRGTMSPDQIRNKERELQERITNAQRQFQTRNRVIQESAQVALNQIQSALIGIIRQVAESHGMNLVLHRQQVALNVNEFDITEQVTEQMNKLLPAVTILPDGASLTPGQIVLAPIILPGATTPTAPSPTPVVVQPPRPGATAPKP